MDVIETLDIISYPDPRLRKKAAPVTEFDERVAALVRRMLKLMHDANGVGLAAPQVGVLWRIFVMNATGEPNDDLVLINPEISAREGSKEGEEGCLSIPEVRVAVRRALRCKIRAQNEQGEWFELAGEDLPARIWQHETDHLDGVLIIDKMGPADQIATKKQLKELERQFEKR